MNFAGHIAVALGGRPPGSGAKPGVEQVSYLLGSALPDLAAIGRFRLSGRSSDPVVADGVDLHHRTDDAFHRHPWFTRHNGEVTAALDRTGLGRGAARACGHVGVELLLDGHLLRERLDLRPAVQAVIDTAGARADQLTPLVEPVHRDRWSAHLARLGDWPVPDDYHEPVAVASRLQRILARRPRLAFGPDQVGMVAEVLADHQAAIEFGAPGLLADLHRDLAPAH